MSTTKKTSKVGRVRPVKKAVEVKDVQRGDIIYIENTAEAIPYLVIDLGSPYILIEDTTTNFAHLYHFINLYKDI